MFSTGENDDCATCEGGHSEAGSSTCVNTPPGYYFDVSNNIDKPCLASTFSKDGAISLAGCTPCADEGSYIDDGASFCLFSPAGFRPTSNRTGTTICPPGSISGIGQDNCMLCEIGKFSENAGSNECRFCSKEDAVVGSTTKQAGSASVDDCICASGKYNQVEDVAYPTCVDVPKGVSVIVDALEKSNLFLEKGFYRASKDTLEILQCEMEIACDGGKVAGDDLCVEGHTGKLCSVCEENCAAVGIGPLKSCEECKGSKTATLAIFCIVVAAALVAFIIVAYKEYNKDLEEGERNDNLERGSSTARRAVKKAKKAKSAISKVGPVVKILVSYSQIVCNFSNIFDMRFPPMFSSLTWLFGALANLDFINFMPLD